MGADEHHPAPQGVMSSSSSAAPAVDGIHWIGGTGLALGEFQAGSPTTVWSHVDAVINLSHTQHPG